ncbi:MAG TPA: hypothetical protein VHE78_14470, partial [Gemmatimonadaceae bacterium]|nr:hypothetical protein [Gemmatimonadaceae bacterium]
MRSSARRPAVGRRRIPLALFVLSLSAACVTRRVRQDERPPVVIAPPRPRADTTKPPEPDIPGEPAPRLRVDGVRDVRVALATAAQAAVVSASGPWRLLDARQAVLVRANAGDGWTVERRGRQLRATRAGSGATPWTATPLTLRPVRDDAFGQFAGHRYRGAVRVV